MRSLGRPAPSWRNWRLHELQSCGVRSGVGGWGIVQEEVLSRGWGAGRGAGGVLGIMKGGGASLSLAKEYDGVGGVEGWGGVRRGGGRDEAGRGGGIARGRWQGGAGRIAAPKRADAQKGACAPPPSRERPWPDPSSDSRPMAASAACCACCAASSPCAGSSTDDSGPPPRHPADPTLSGGPSSETSTSSCGGGGGGGKGSSVGGWVGGWAARAGGGRAVGQARGAGERTTLRTHSTHARTAQHISEHSKHSTRTWRGTAASMATIAPLIWWGPCATTRLMAASVSKVTNPNPRWSRLLALSGGGGSGGGEWGCMSGWVGVELVGLVWG